MREVGIHRAVVGAGFFVIVGLISAVGTALVYGIGGYLVDVTGPGQFVWRTSLSRSDSGAGACEIVYVETLDVR